MCKRRYSGCFIYKQQNVAGTPLSHCNLTEFILPFSQMILPAVFWFCFLMSPCTSRVLLTHFVFFCYHALWLWHILWKGLLNLSPFLPSQSHFHSGCPHYFFPRLLLSSIPAFFPFLSYLFPVPYIYIV